MNAVAEIENAAGASPIVLVCEHASNRFPDEFGDLGLTAEEREMHIAWDPGALGVARFLSRRLDAPLVHATVSRLVIDLNRDPSAPDSITTLSERTRIAGNENIGETERARRVAIYHAFHEAAGGLVEQRLAEGQVRAIVSLHSFTPVYRDLARPWHVGLIFDEDARLARDVTAGLARQREIVVGMNEPYAPNDRVFHTLERHAVRRGLAPLMIEIRNDLIRSEEGQQAWAERLSPLLESAVARL